MIAPTIRVTKDYVRKLNDQETPSTANCSKINNRGYDLASKLRDYLPYYILIQNTTHISYEISLPLRKNGVSEQTFEHTFTKSQVPLCHY